MTLTVISVKLFQMRTQEECQISSDFNITSNCMSVVLHLLR